MIILVKIARVAYGTRMLRITYRLGVILGEHEDSEGDI